jgi:hypothetical protein
MYAHHKSSLTAVGAYSEKLAEEFKRLEDELDKCVKECPCASDAYVRLFIMSALLAAIRRKA